MYRLRTRILFLKQMLENGNLGTLRFLHRAFTLPFDVPSNSRAKKEYGGGALPAFTAWISDHATLQCNGGFHFDHKNFAPSDHYEAMVTHFID